MKLIGVTGKAGSGKTTFSNILAEKTNMGVIHVDDIITKIKLKYFKLFMNKNKDGEKIKVNSNFKNIVYRNKILFSLFMKFRAKLIERPLELEIERVQSEGKKFIIIDDIFIKYQKRFKDLSKIIVLERPYALRKEALQQRDNLTKDEIVTYDSAHFYGNYKEIIKTKNVEKVFNTGSKEDLKEKAENIYKKYFISMKERYKQNESTIYGIGEKETTRTKSREDKEKD